MNPRLTDQRILDHHDYTHDSGLKLGYFEPTYSYRGEWLIVVAIVAVAALTTLYYFAGMV